MDKQYGNFARDVVDEWAKDPNHVALFEQNTCHSITFKDISDKSKAISGALRLLGLDNGDRVILLMGRTVEWWYCMTALIRSGLVVIPCTTQLTEKDFIYRVQSANVKAVIAEDGLVALVNRAKEACPTLRYYISINDVQKNWLALNDMMREVYQFDFDQTRLIDPCLIFYTSGTTGEPKKVLHNHCYPFAHKTTGQKWLQLTAASLHLNISDTGWAKAAWSSYFGPWHQGATVFIQSSKRFDVDELLETLTQFPITSLCAPPTVFRALVASGKLLNTQFTALQHVVCAGEPLNVETYHAWKQQTRLDLYEGYGQSETTALAGRLPCDPYQAGSMGKALLPYRLAIVDAQGKQLSTNEVGIIAVKVKPNKPLGLFVCYESDGAQTSQAFRGDYYLTGDTGYIDEHGCLFFGARADDVIISAGYRIGPFEIENILLSHPAVLESAAVAVPDPLRGHIVKSFIVLKPDYAPTEKLALELQQYVKTQTAAYKYPREIEFLSQLPKTISGKIQRKKLREVAYSAAC